MIPDAGAAGDTHLDFGPGLGPGPAGLVRYFSYFDPSDVQLQTLVICPGICENGGVSVAENGCASSADIKGSI